MIEHSLMCLMGWKTAESERTSRISLPIVYALPPLTDQAEGYRAWSVGWFSEAGLHE